MFQHRHPLRDILTDLTLVCKGFFVEFAKAVAMHNFVFHTKTNRYLFVFCKLEITAIFVQFPEYDLSAAFCQVRSLLTKFGQLFLMWQFTFIFCRSIIQMTSSILEISRIERMAVMNLAKISANGQITLPVEIRRLLGLKSGDKVLFFQKQDGEIVLSNASAKAIRKAQSAFAGAAENMGIHSESDVQALVDEVRYGREA